MTGFLPAAEHRQVMERSLLLLLLLLLSEITFKNRQSRNPNKCKSNNSLTYGGEGSRPHLEIIVGDEPPCIFEPSCSLLKKGGHTIY